MHTLFVTFFNFCVPFAGRRHRPIATECLVYWEWTVQFWRLITETV